MNRHVRSFIAVATITLAAAPFIVAISNPPRAMPLAERMAAARADILARPCMVDDDCHRRVASYEVDPTYYEGPMEWLESGCLAKRDRTACAYLAAWREIEPDGE